jgi:DNA-binding response OmpR family regulator
MSPRLLVVEDDPHVRRGLEVLLAGQGHEVLVATTGPEALIKAEAARPDLILLDVMLPGASGFEVLQGLRARDAATPVIMLTAKGAELDRVQGFALGVDDYVVKPFSMLELLGRIQAVLRRAAPAGPAPLDVLRVGAVTVDFAHHAVTRGGERLAVPERAVELLEVLVRASGAIVSRDRLIEAVWGRDAQVNARTLDNLVLALRQAIEPTPRTPVHLLTVHGRGFRFLADP